MMSCVIEMSCGTKIETFFFEMWFIILQHSMIFPECWNVLLSLAVLTITQKLCDNFSVICECSHENCQLADYVKSIKHTK